VEYVIRDYQKPMGVLRYSTMEAMPQTLRSVLPDIEGLRRELAEQGRGDEDTI